MAYIRHREAHEHFRDRVLEGIKLHFPIEGRKQTLHLDSLEVGDSLHPDDLRAQCKAKITGGTWAVPVHATLTLRESGTGKVLDTKRMKVAEIPHITRRYSYIVNGQEYQVDNQWQLKPGIYTQRRQNGELESRFNVVGRGAFDLVFHPDTKQFVMDYNDSKIPLYPILKAMGVSDEQMEKSWGKEIYEANKNAKRVAGALTQFAKTTLPPGAEVPKDSVLHVQKVLSESRLNPDATELTVGKRFDRVDGEALRLATKKLLSVQSGHPEDDRDSLIFKELRSVGDYAYDMLKQARKDVKAKVDRKVDNSTDIRNIIKFDTLNKPLREVFTKNTAARVATQINPAEMISASLQTTILGPGGISSERSVTDDAKLINPSHFGFVDPINTPEGCFDSETQVFTRAGWVFWDAVDMQTEFACLINGRLEFHKPLELQKYEYTGLMYGVRKPWLEYLVTPNHRVLCRPYDAPGRSNYCVVRADQAHGTPKTFLMTHEPSAGADREFFELPTDNPSGGADRVDMHDWAALMGWFLSGGSVVRDAATSSYMVELLHSHAVDRENCDRIEALLNRLPWEWGVTEQPNGHLVYTIGGGQLAKYMSQFGCGNERYIPEYFFDLPPPVRMELLGALLAGGGRPCVSYKNKRRGFQCYTTTSRRLSLDVERLAISLGRAATWHQYRGGRGGVYPDTYEVRILRGKEQSVLPGKGHYYVQEYKGMVYCATVPGSFLYVRRAQKRPIWMGNSKTGITLRLASGVVKVGTEPRIPLYNLKTKRVEYVPPKDVVQSNVVLADQVRWVDGHPVPLRDKVKMLGPGNEPSAGSMREAHYVMRRPSHFLNITTNLIPFVGNTNGARAGYASRHLEQAISLIHREAPLVQASTGVAGDMDTFDKLVGGTAAHRSLVTGTVERVGHDHILIKDEKGKPHEVQLYHNFPLNDLKSMLHSEPLVRPGDKVTAGQVVADTNYSKNGVLALGTNLRVGFLPYKGYNFEDGLVISESAAKKLSSQHMYKHEMAVKEGMVLDPKKFQVQHPAAFTREQYKLIGDDGVVQVGARVKPGDPLIVAMSPYQLKDRSGLSAIRKSLSGTHTDASLKWEGEHEGEVVGVHKTGDKVIVHVRTVEPMRPGDKMSNRYGGKGIVTAILPDVEMPHTKDGKPIDVAFNPSGVPGRMNIGQVLEVAAGKIAQKTGKTYIANNFEAGEKDTLQRMQKELKQHGLSDTEELFDPITKKSLGHVLVGPQHMFKLVHQVDKKLAVRPGMSLPGVTSEAAYSPSTLQPSGGGHAGGQAIGALGVYALLAHGARANLREMQSFKSEGPDPRGNPAKAWPSQHSQVWAAIQTGAPLPTPRPTFAFKKFENMLKGAGINIEKKGHNFILGPLTDSHILELSNGELKDPTRAVAAKVVHGDEPAPLPGGIFDERITGGHGGTKWSHITLAEPLPNPIFEGPIKHLTGLTKADYEEVLYGKKAISSDGRVVPLGHGLTGGPAIKSLLDKIEVKSELKRAEEQLKKAPESKVDRALKRVKYLRALDQLGVKTPSEAYILHYLPVLPPSSRPLSVLPSGDIKYDDINGLYRQFGQVNMQLKDPALQRALSDKRKENLRKDFYDGVRAVMGVHIPYSDAPNKGLLHIISGATPKTGYFQDVLVSRRQDLSMRSTIIPEPALGLDEVGLPRHAALQLFAPLVVRRLVQNGGAPHALEAQKKLAAVINGKEDPLVWKALESTMNERPVLLKRDPALHKYSVQAFKARTVHGSAIKIHPLVTGGFNADFDGDSCLGDLTVVLSGAALEGRLRADQPPYQVTVIDISTFPRIEETAVHKPSGVVEYDVPAGVYVPAYSSGSMEVKPVTKFSVHPNCEEWKVATRNGREITCSSDHSLALLDPETLEVVKAPPRGAVGRYLPIMRSLSEPKLRASLPPALCSSSETRAVAGAAPPTFSSGWFVGASAEGGHLPPKFLEYPEEFRQGLFCGLVDAGGAVHWSGGKDRSRLTLSFFTANKERADGIQLLGLSLGLPASRTVCGHDDQSAYVITFSSRPIRDARWICLKHPDKKAALAKFWESGSVEPGHNDFVPMTERARDELLGRLRELGAGAQPSESNGCTFPQYAALQRGAPIITRAAAEQLSALLSGCELSDYLRKWFSVVLDSTVGWDVVETAEATGARKVMYDITVPGAWTFTMANGAVLWDTMSVYVPITDDAVNEARKMFPSNNLFSEATGKLAYQPSNENVVGLYKLSTVGKTTPHKFDTLQAAIDALAAGKIRYNDVVHIGGKPSTAGRALLAEALPAPMRPEVMHNLDLRLNGKGVGKLLTTLAKNHKADYGEVVNKIKDIGNDAAFGILRRGEVSISIGAHTLGLADLAADKESREAALAVASKKIAAIARAPGLSQAEKEAKAIQVWEDAAKHMRVLHEAKLRQRPNNLFVMYEAGVKPKIEQYKQLALAPMLMKDAQGRVIPNPVTTTYGEGLDIASYWTHLHGTRRGTVRKVQEVQDPGYLTKLMHNTASHLNVDQHDCGTKDGIAMHIGDPEVHDRYLQQDFKAGGLHVPAGTLLTPDVVGKMRTADKNAQIVVRSPLRCESDKGICAKCAGLNADGQHHHIGDAVGVHAVHALGERAVQLTLKEFHTGGVTGATGMSSSLDRMMQLTYLPQKIPDAATLANVTGKVEKAERDPTGTKIWINGVPHHVGKDRFGHSLATHAPGASSTVYNDRPWHPPVVGTHVEAGQPLSDPTRSVVNPHDLYAATKSVEKLQNHLTNEIYKLYKDEGVRRKHVEILVKAMTSATRIKDPGDSTLLRGEAYPLAHVNRLNQQLQGKKIVHEPIIKGVDMLPHDLHTDWMAKLQHERLINTLTEAAATLGVSSIHSPHPIPALAYGAEFGLTQEHAHKPGLGHLKDVPPHHY